jgi:hypothetical protein
MGEIKLGYSAKDGKWVLMDNRIWTEVDTLDNMFNYLRNTVKLHMEGEIVVKKIEDKWYMRDISKYLRFSTPEEMMDAFRDIDKNYVEEIIQSSESLFGEKKSKRGINMGRMQTYMKDVSTKTEVKVQESKQFCAWHPTVDFVVVCGGCEKNLCEHCIGKRLDEEHVLCNTCWTEYKYSRHLEKFKKQREQK